MQLSSSTKTLLLKFPLMIFWRPLDIQASRSMKFCLQLAPLIVHDVFRSATDSVDPTSLIHCFNRTTCTCSLFTSEIRSPDPQISETKPCFELKCSASSSWEVVSPSTCSGSSTRTSTFCGGQRISSTVKKCCTGQASGHPLQQTNSAPHHQ